MGRLVEKVAVITGGAGGIGMAAGKRFAAEGAQVLLVDLNEQALIDACSEIGGNHVSYLVGDVTRAADNARMVETATERYGGVDIFLANAGIEGDVGFAGLAIAQDDETDGGHLLGQHLVAPHRRRQLPRENNRKRGEDLFTSRHQRLPSPSEIQLRTTRLGSRLTQRSAAPATSSSPSPSTTSASSTRSSRF